MNIPTIGTNKISRTVRGVVERGQTRLSWLQPGLVSTHRARTGVNINNQGKWWIKRRVATIFPTKNHRNMYLTRMLPSNAGGKVVSVILYDFLTRGWVIFMQFAGVLSPAITKEEKVSSPRKAQQKTKYVIWTHDFRWLGPAAINILTPNLQTSQQGCLQPKTHC